MRGMHMRHDGWAELVDDEEHGGWLIPMMMLYHEHDEDSEMRPERINAREARGHNHAHGGWASGAYRYFRAHREDHAGSAFAPESQRSTPKVGRNDPCPCGSGKKYMKCCGGATVS